MSYHGSFTTMRRAVALSLAMLALLVFATHLSMRSRRAVAAA